MGETLTISDTMSGSDFVSLSSHVDRDLCTATHSNGQQL